MNALLSTLFIIVAVSNFVSRNLVEYTFLIFFILFFVVFFLKTPRQRFRDLFPKIGFGYLLIGLLASILLSHIVNNNLGEHEISEIGEYRWLLGIFPLVAALAAMKNKKIYLQIYLGLISALSVVWLTLYFFPENGVIGYPNRMKGFFHSPTDFGHAILFPFLFAITLLFARGKSDSWKERAIYLISAGLIGLAFLLTFTRSVQLAAFFAILFLTLLLHVRIFVTTCIAFLLIATGIYSTDFLGLRERFDIGPSLAQTTDVATIQRLKLMEGHAAIFLDHPVFGVGYHHNQHRLRPYYDKMGLETGFLEAHAHNQILNFLSGTGIIGAGFYCILLATLFHFALSNFRHLQKKSFEWQISLATVIILVGFFIAGLTDTNFELMAPKYNLLIVMAIIAHQRQKRLEGNPCNNSQS